jgi:formylglycine-generating enzyme required for sulfatase activity
MFNRFQRFTAILVLLLFVLVSCEQTPTGTKDQCATPSLNPAGGTYTDPQSVTITCETEGATIRYTIDGTNPTASSTIYSNPINVNSSITIKAQAFKEGWTNSQIISALYTIPIQTVAVPTFNPVSGTYSSGQDVSISCATSGAKIHYTTDGTIPDSSSQIYSAPLNIVETTIIKAKAFKVGWEDSSISSAMYTIIIQTVEAPVFDPLGGTYTASQVVTVSCATPGATIRYTTNGIDPTSSSTLYTNPISINSTMTIKAEAFKDGWYPSQITTAAYDIQNLTVATPTFNPKGGTYSFSPTVRISCATAGATIRYTTNGTEPISSSIPYVNPLIVTSSETLKAKAFKSGLNDSQTATAHFTINIPIPANFIFVPGGTFNNGSSNITLSAFYIDKYEIMQMEYQSVMDINPATGNGVGDAFPVYYTSWFNAIEYCNRRSVQEELMPCYTYSSYGTNTDYWPVGWNSNPNNHTNVFCDWNASGYRLPTEAEWLYAARAANETPNYIYSGSNDINSVAWYIENSGNVSHSVGTKAPNALGLYDMSGNEWEWNWDIYAPYPTESQTNPHGAESGIYRMARGGASQAYATSCTVAYRSYGLPTVSYYYLGFRVCRNVPE